MKNDPKHDQKTDSELDDVEQLDETEDTDNVDDTLEVEDAKEESDEDDTVETDTDSNDETDETDEGAATSDVPGDKTDTDEPVASEDTDASAEDSKDDETSAETEEEESTGEAETEDEAETKADTKSEPGEDTPTKPDEKAEEEESQETQDALEALESSEDPSVFKDKESVDTTVSADGQASEAPAAALPEQNFALPIAPIERKWYHNRGLVVSIASVVVIALVGAAYAFYVANTQPRVQPATNTVVEKKETPKPLMPFAVAYSVEKQQNNPAADDCLASESKIYQQALSGEAPVTALDLKDGQSVAQQAVREKMVLVATMPTCVSKEAPSIWLSKDSGKTYEKLFTSPKPAAEGSMGDQITSMIFSNDGKSVVFGLLPNDDTMNVVKEINIETKEVKDLFTSSERGVFLSAYDKTAQKVYYSSGCYNCDASSYSKMWVRDTAKGADSILFDDKDYRGVSNVVKKDFSKVLRVKLSQQDFMSDATYVIEEFDIASKKAKTLASFTGSGSLVPTAGYTDEDTPSAYYTSDKQLNIVGSDGKPTTALQAAKTITQVHHVGKDKIVYSAGDQQKSVLTSYSVESKESSNLLDYDYLTRIFGVTWN